eukprot:2585425-Amphidinium_carterae.1
MAKSVLVCPTHVCKCHPWERNAGDSREEGVQAHLLCPKCVQQTNPRMFVRIEARSSPALIYHILIMRKTACIV